MNVSARAGHGHGHGAVVNGVPRLDTNGRSPRNGVPASPRPGRTVATRRSHSFWSRRPASALRVLYKRSVFTGLVQTRGTVRSVGESPQARRLTIASDLAMEHLALGASVAVSGVCLTVVSAQAGRFAVDVAFETLRRTTFERVGIGSEVNLEPSLRMGDPLGGHLVSGHVDGVGSLRSSRERGQARELWFDMPAELLRFVAPKGSVCVDGVSLTVNEVDTGGFMVGVIPHTLEVTTLGSRRVGDPVNLEVDIIARYVARLLDIGGATAADTAGGVTLEQLRRAGYDTPERQ